MVVSDAFRGHWVQVVVLDVLQLCPVCMYKCSNKYPYILGGSVTYYIEPTGAVTLV